MWRRAYGRMAALFVVGGCTDIRERGVLASVEKMTFQKVDGKVIVKSELIGSLRIPRRSPSVFQRPSSSDLLIFGGCEYEGKHLNSCEILSTDGKSREEPQPCDFLQESSCSSFAQLTEKTGIIVGGFSGNDCLQQVVTVDCDTLEGKKLPNIISRLKNSCAVPMGPHEVLLFGGWDERETMSTIFRLRMDDRLENHSLDMAGLLPYPIEGHSCVRHGNSIFIVGGYDGLRVVNTVVRYDTQSHQKQVLSTRLATARENHVCGLVLGDYLVVAGGWDGGKALDSVEVFLILDKEPVLERVQCDVRLISPRNRPAAIVA